METNRKKSYTIIEELIKQWKLIQEFDDDDRKDLVLANQERFWERVKDLTTEEYSKLADIIWPKDK